MNDRVPWSSGYMIKISIERLWACIPAPDTGWTFFQIILLSKW